MSATMLDRTGSRTVAREAVTGRPGAADLVDAGFLLALVAIALWGFRTTFDSPLFLAAGLAGAAIGVGVSHVATVLRQHWLVLGLLAVVAFFLFGGAVTFSAAGGLLPGPHTVGVLALLSVTGWKELLTTVPPVSGRGQLLVLPYLLGLASGSLGHGLGRRTSRPSVPVVVPTATLVAVTLLGTGEPAALLVQGLGFTLAGFSWVVVRRARLVRTVGTGAARRSQAVLAALLLLGAAAAGGLLGGHVPGADAGPRVVLRTYVQPPFDVTQYPSPLAGFRKYTEGAKTVWDQPLLTVDGLAAGDLLRFAVLDDYSGTVWSAGTPVAGGPAGSFRKVGSRIAASAVPATGPVRTVTLRVAPAYAGLADANVWLPGTGYPSAIRFEGADAARPADSLRYNGDTGQALVPARLRAGDVVTSTQTGIALAGKDLTPSGTPSLLPGATDPVAAWVTKRAGAQPTAWQQLLAVADALQRDGAYSDGLRGGEFQYLPGHGLARITSFLALPQTVGNDEQYAATFALAANHLGIQARVVLGGVVADDGTIRGRDVHAWVEVRGDGGAWFAVPQTRFMPDRDKHPKKQPPDQEPETAAADVPPPNAARPPGSPDSAPENRPVQRSSRKGLFGGLGLPGWLVTALTVAAYPVGVLVGIPLLLALLRGLRRRRRQRAGAGDLRLARGWQDYVDHARDLGIRVPAGLTRREQADLVGRPDLAAAADRAVFGAGVPDERTVRSYWTAIGTARRGLTGSASRRARVLRRYSVRGLLARDRRHPALLTLGGRS